MLIWLLAVTVGVALAVVQYRLGGALRPPILIALRALALTIILALMLDASSGSGKSVRPYAALDVSQSWLATGDTAVWRRALRSLDSVGADTVLLVGDSVRAGIAPGVPGDGATRVAPLIERALGAGRPVTFVTDGAWTSPTGLPNCPRDRMS